MAPSEVTKLTLKQLEAIIRKVNKLSKDMGDETSKAHTGPSIDPADLPALQKKWWKEAHPEDE